MCLFLLQRQTSYSCGDEVQRIGTTQYVGRFPQYLFDGSQGGDEFFTNQDSGCIPDAVQGKTNSLIQQIIELHIFVAEVSCRDTDPLSNCLWWPR